MSENSTPSGDPVLYHGPEFGTVPTALITDASILPGARLLCALLWTYRNKDSGEAFPSQERMARQLGCSVRAIRKYLTALEGAKWLRRTKRIRKDPDWRGNPNACLYEVFWSKGKQRETGTLVPNGPERVFLSDRNRRAAEHTNRTDQKNTNIYSDEIIQKLKEEGVFPNTARRLIREYGKGGDFTQLEVGLGSGLKGPELVAFIEGEYQEPVKPKGSAAAWEPQVPSRYGKLCPACKRSEQFCQCDRNRICADCGYSKAYCLCERSGPQKIGDVLP